MKQMLLYTKDFDALQYTWRSLHTTCQASVMRKRIPSLSTDLKNIPKLVRLIYEETSLWWCHQACDIEAKEVWYCLNPIGGISFTLQFTLDTTIHNLYTVLAHASPQKSIIFPSVLHTVKAMQNYNFTFLVPFEVKTFREKRKKKKI
jgi:hypothetical protein